VYRHIPASVQGPGVKLVGSQTAVKGAVPLALLRGVATWHLPSGGLDTQLLATHQGLEEGEAGPDGGTDDALGGGGSGPRPATSTGRRDLLAARCQQAIALCHWQAALRAATALGDPEGLQELALAALQFLEVGVAAAAFEAAGDEEAAAALRPLLGEQDEGLVMGMALALTGGEEGGG
jgi:WD repeat-containing protein 19